MFRWRRTFCVLLFANNENELRKKSLTATFEIYHTLGAVMSCSPALARRLALAVLGFIALAEYVQNISFTLPLPRSVTRIPFNRCSLIPLVSCLLMQNAGNQMCCSRGRCSKWKLPVGKVGYHLGCFCLCRLVRHVSLSVTPLMHFLGSTYLPFSITILQTLWLTVNP